MLVLEHFSLGLFEFFDIRVPLSRELRLFTLRHALFFKEFARLPFLFGFGCPTLFDSVGIEPRLLLGAHLLHMKAFL